MTCQLINHEQFIKNLAKVKGDKSELYKLIKNSNHGEIKAISELAFNILNGNVYCYKIRIKNLKIHAKNLRLFASKNNSLKKKRKNLLKGSGIFLSALLPLAIDSVSAHATCAHNISLILSLCVHSSHKQCFP